MCGIAGQLCPEGGLTEASLVAMRDVLAHRGPDGEGLYLGPGRRVGLVHRRLAIIDLETGDQPLYNEDRSVVLVMNGEIYNFEELRRDLVAAGHHFRSRADAEVVIHLYEEQGIDAVRELRGMFAFALYDLAADLLLLARDRLGQKPLVYGSRNDRFAFASELNALAVGIGPLTLDLAGLDAYLTLGYVPAPLTIYHEARKLPPGHIALVRGSSLEPTLVRYWEPHFTPKLKLGRREAEWRLRERLAQSVSLRLVGDVPVGLWLSGGVDSSVVATSMVAAASEPVMSFTAGSPDPEFDESGPARAVADALGTEHHEFGIGPDALEALDDLVYRFGEPFADSSSLPCWWLARATRSFVKVVLTGDGGDELFAGYPRYRYLAAFRLLDGLLPASAWRALSRKPLPRVWRRACELMALPEEMRPLELACTFGPERKARLMRGLVTPDLGEETILSAYQAKPLGLIERLLHMDLVTYLPGDLQVKLDMSSMAWGLEARAPLLDHKLVEFVARLPTRFKFRLGRSKTLLKGAHRDALPPGTLERRKQGFGLPIKHWFKQGLAERVREALKSSRLAELGLLDLAYAQEQIEEHERGEAPNEHRLWSLLVLARWLERAPAFRLPPGIGAG